MRVINGNANFNRLYVLIEKEGEFEKYIELAVTARNWSVAGKDYDHIAQQHGIKGSRIHTVQPLPYIMVIEFDDKHEEAIIDFISKEMFEPTYECQ